MAKQRAGLSDVSAKEHYTELIRANEARIHVLDSQNVRYAALWLDAAAKFSEIRADIRAAKEAITKAEVASEKRFESVNEFRETLSDQQRTYIARTEVEGMVKALNDKLEAAQREIGARISTGDSFLIARVEKIETALLASTSAKGGIREGYLAVVGIIGFLFTLLLLANLVLSYLKGK